MSRPLRPRRNRGGEKRMETIGFIGLGRMGRPMASNLCRKGFRLIVNDINLDAVAELESLQASSAP
ncbi:MAG: hydroxyacid dehydrogenase, partial [Tardiphaga sp.]|nr:hydroxyacid dehydrogenase [Tardiphaga sp.]